MTKINNSKTMELAKWLSVELDGVLPCSQEFADRIDNAIRAAVQAAVKAEQNHLADEADKEARDLACMASKESIGDERFAYHCEADRLRKFAKLIRARVAK